MCNLPQWIPQKNQWRKYAIGLVKSLFSSVDYCTAKSAWVEYNKCKITVRNICIADESYKVFSCKPGPLLRPNWNLDSDTHKYSQQSGQFNNFPAQATRKLTKSGRNMDIFYKFPKKISQSRFFVFKNI